MAVVSEERPVLSWSEIAAWYDEIVTAESGPHDTALQALLELVPVPTAGLLLDVACGQGLATRALAARGANRVIGIDSAAAMLELASKRTDPAAPISWLLDDAEGLQGCQSQAFDGVTCQLGLMDIADLESTLDSIHRVLKPGGWFVFVISHPAFLAPHAETVTDSQHRSGRLISRYFDPEFWRSANPNGIRGRAGNYHRPLHVYLNALINAGFRLDAFTEPRASPLLAEQQPVYTNVPIFLAARATAVS